MTDHALPAVALADMLAAASDDLGPRLDAA